MLSQNKQKQMLCPFCGNADISKQRMYGQMSGMCLADNGCSHWWPWNDRLIVPWDCDAKTIKQKVKQYRKRILKSRGGYLGILRWKWFWFKRDVMFILRRIRL